VSHTHYHTVKYANSITLPVMIADYAKSVMSVRIKMSKQFITKAHYPKSPEDINIYTIHPPKSNLILLYEVVDKQGRGIWGGEDPEQAFIWFKKSGLEQSVRIMVSAWDSDEEDAHLVGQTIDITPIVVKAWNKGKEISL